MGNPRKHTKIEFIEYLKRNGITNGVLKRIERLPDMVNVDENKYQLNIITSWYNEGNTHYEFEINYYSPELMEVLLPYVIKNDVEVSLNVVECELMKRNLVDFDANCNV